MPRLARSSPRSQLLAALRLVSILATLVSVCLSSTHAWAQANDAAAAQSLFNDAKRLMNAEQYAAACPKFAESQRLDPGIGTLLWLAQCHLKNGRNASAWALFQEAEAFANKTKDPRASLARDEARKLERKLSKLVIEVPVESNVEGLEVKRDGVALGKPLWGTSIPTDPGVHHITASAPDKTTWETEVTVPRDAGSATVKIPVLEAAPPTPAPAVPPPPAPPTPPVESAPPPPDDQTKGRTQRIIGITLIGIGVAGAAVGGYFGLQVSSKLDDAKPHCNGNVCNQSGFDARNDALSSATISNVAFIAAGFAIVGGAVLYFAAPRSSSKTSVAISPLLGGAVLHGRF